MLARGVVTVACVCPEACRQINALNLLITAFQSRTFKDQQTLLEQSQSRKVFDHIKDDSSSLIALCDAASFTTKRTKTTTATSKFSMNFDIDTELLQARAYKSTLRSLMRRAFRPSYKHSIQAGERSNTAQNDEQQLEDDFEPFVIAWGNAFINPRKAPDPTPARIRLVLTSDLDSIISKPILSENARRCHVVRVTTPVDCAATDTPKR